MELLHGSGQREKLIQMLLPTHFWRLRAKSTNTEQYLGIYVGWQTEAARVLPSNEFFPDKLNGLVACEYVATRYEEGRLKCSKPKMCLKWRFHIFQGHGLVVGMVVLSKGWIWSS